MMKKGFLCTSPKSTEGRVFISVAQALLSLAPGSRHSAVLGVQHCPSYVSPAGLPCKITYPTPPHASELLQGARPGIRGWECEGGRAYIL